MQMRETVWNESFRPGIISSTKLYFQDLFVGAKRMSRKDFWWGYLGITIIADIIVSLLGLAVTKMPVMDYYWSTLIGVAMAMTWGYYMIAVFTAMIRRLHDRKMRGWWILVSLVPFVGEIALLVLLALPQRDFGNKWARRLQS